MPTGILCSVSHREHECFVLPSASTNLWNLGWLGNGFVGWTSWCVTDLLTRNLATYWGKSGCLPAFVWLQIKYWLWNNLSWEDAWMGSATAGLQYEEWFRGGQKSGFFSLFDLWLHCIFLLWVNTKLSACFIKQFPLPFLCMQNDHSPPSLPCFSEYFLPSVPVSSFPYLDSMLWSFPWIWQLCSKILEVNNFGEEKHGKLCTDQNFWKILQVYKVL